MTVSGACRPRRWLRGAALLVAALLTLPITGAVAKAPSAHDVRSARSLIGDLGRYYQAVVNRVFSLPAPSFSDLHKDLGSYLTARRDRALVRRVRNLAARYTGFAFNLA